MLCVAFPFSVGPNPKIPIPQKSRTSAVEDASEASIRVLLAYSEAGKGRGGPEGMANPIYFRKMAPLHMYVLCNMYHYSLATL